MAGLDWSRTQQEAKASADRDPSRPGEVVLESWIEGSKRPRKSRPFPTVVSAVSAAWAGRPATISPEGVLSIVLRGQFGPYTLKQRIRAHGNYISGASWRAMKALLTT